MVVQVPAPLPGSDLLQAGDGGECHLRVGRMSGTFGPGGQIHVLRGLDHEITSLTEQSKLLRFECAFVPFAGVPLGHPLHPALARISLGLFAGAGLLALRARPCRSIGL